MTRIAFPLSLSRHPVTIPVGDGAAPVEGDAPATGTSPVAGADFAVGDVVLTHWGADFREGVVTHVTMFRQPTIYTVAVATADGRRMTPVARYADELEAVVW